MTQAKKKKNHWNRGELSIQKTLLLSYWYHKTGGGGGGGEEEEGGFRKDTTIALFFQKS